MSEYEFVSIALNVLYQGGDVSKVSEFDNHKERYDC
jgi:hypothetical protein